MRQLTAATMNKLPLVIRYVDSDGKSQETFVGFYECRNGVTGKAIYDLLLNAIRNLGLDINKCRGQCYDGTGNMARKVKGAAGLIRQDYPKAMYFHCTAHGLNLCMVNSCEVQAVWNMMGIMHEIANFFKFSPKWEGLLPRKIEDFCPESAHSKLKGVRKMRRVERTDSMEVMTELFSAIIETLEEIRLNQGKSWNAESTTKATGLYHATGKFEFFWLWQ